MNIIQALKNWNDKRIVKARHNKALEKYGWDGRCPKCECFIHGDGCAKVEAVTTWHWIYRCDCGEQSAWFVGMLFPVYDNGKRGYPDWKSELYRNINILEKQ